MKDRTILIIFILYAVSHTSATHVNNLKSSCET